MREQGRIMEKCFGKVTNVRFRMKGNRALYGQNVGDFPRHHFSYLFSQTSPGSQALQVSFGGPDESIRGVWRRRENSDLFSLEFLQQGRYEYRQNGKSYECGPGGLHTVSIQ